MIYGCYNFFMRLLQLISIFLILVLALSPVMASKCSITCAVGSKHVVQQTTSIDMFSMDASHCNAMQKSLVHHGKQAQPYSCTMVGCQFLVATLLGFTHQDFAFNDRINQPLHFNAFGPSADSYPPIKPPA